MASAAFNADPQPDDHIEFMMQWMQKQYGKRPGINTNERNELEYLRKEKKRLEELLGAEAAAGGSDDEDSGSGNNNRGDSDDDDSPISSEEEEEEVADLIQVKPNAK